MTIPITFFFSPQILKQWLLQPLDRFQSSWSSGSCWAAPESWISQEIESQCSPVERKRICSKIFRCGISEEVNHDQKFCISTSIKYEKSRLALLRAFYKCNEKIAVFNIKDSGEY